MKWLKSTTDKAYTAQGIIIPPSSSKPLAVNEDKYNKIIAMPVIKSLINTHGIIVLDKYTDLDAQTSSAAQQKIETLQGENQRLADKVRELEAKSAEADSSKTTSKKVKQAEERATNAEQALAELQEKYAALEKEANEKIAELSAKVEGE